MPMNNRPRNAGQQQLSPLLKLAGRIANLAIPSTANSIFSDIQKSHIRRFGNNFGSATDPRQFFMQANPFSDQIKIGLGSTMSLKDAQNRIDRETRSELANRTGYKLPQFLGPRKLGIGSSQQEVVGRLGDTQEESKGNTMYVDDARWPVTLKQILGSKMLTPDQLKKASIQNISSYMTVQGGTQTERAEMHYMFQRMMLEGFIRGVDITRDFKSAGVGGRNPKLNIVLTPGSTVASNANNIGLSTQRGTVKFNVGYMRRQPENIKMALFYHEIGHELLNKEHSSAEGILKSGGSNRAGKNLLKSTASYNAIMNQLFTPNGALSNGSKHMKIPVNKSVDTQLDPSWFPSAKEGETGYDPGGADGGGSGGDTTSLQPYIISPETNISQTTINPFQPKEGAGSQGTIDTSSSNRPNTMNVAAPQAQPMGGVQVNQGFSAGYSQQQQQSGPSLQGIAGALNQLRAG